MGMARTQAICKALVALGFMDLSCGVIRPVKIGSILSTARAALHSINKAGSITISVKSLLAILSTISLTYSLVVAMEATLKIWALARCLTEANNNYMYLAPKITTSATTLSTC